MATCAVSASYDRLWHSLMSRRYVLHVLKKTSICHLFHKSEESLSLAKIVCVRNKKKKKDWIAFICTDPDLSEKEILRIYGKRWQIEVFFKTCKTYLRLISECHSLLYDALTAHVAIVFARYMMIAMEQRRNEDDRSLGEIFFFFTDELADITFAESFQIILRAMFECIYTVFQVTDEQISAFIEMFVDRLPEYMRRALLRGSAVA